MAISNPFYNPNTYGYESVDYFRRQEDEYRRYLREKEEQARYAEEQRYRMMNAAPVAPKEAPKPKAPDPLGFMNKAENKLLLTTGELK